MEQPTDDRFMKATGQPPPTGYPPSPAVTPPRGDQVSGRGWEERGAGPGVRAELAQRAGPAAPYRFYPVVGPGPAPPATAQPRTPARFAGQPPRPPAQTTPAEVQGQPALGRRGPVTGPLLTRIENWNRRSGDTRTEKRDG